MGKNYGRVAIGLSGGAAKGLAHIGVLKALEEHGIEPDYIAGTSAGALVGGLYCAGISVRELERITTTIDKTNFRDLVDFTWAKGSMVAGRKVEEFLRGIVGNVHIENLEKPFIATAGDYHRMYRLRETYGEGSKAASTGERKTRICKSLINRE
jgi:NTE family protein